MVVLPVLCHLHVVFSGMTCWLLANVIGPQRMWSIAVYSILLHGDCIKSTDSWNRASNCIDGVMILSRQVYVSQHP
jgi:hypothetical protein